MSEYEGKYDRRLLAEFRAVKEALASVMAERDALNAAVQSHNEGCKEACESMSAMHCNPYLARGGRCPDCPKDWVIDFPKNSAAAEGKE